MTSGDIITWVLFVIIMAAFAVGVRHIVCNFVSGESDCCKGGSSPFCAGCAKEETTARERENAAKAWAAIRAEAREKRGASSRCGASRTESGRCPACREKSEKQ